MTTTVFLYFKKQVYIQGLVTEIYIQFIRRLAQFLFGLCRPKWCWNPLQNFFIQESINTGKSWFESTEDTFFTSYNRNGTTIFYVIDHSRHVRVYLPFAGWRQYIHSHVNYKWKIILFLGINPATSCTAVQRSAKKNWKKELGQYPAIFTQHKQQAWAIKLLGMLLPCVCLCVSVCVFNWIKWLQTIVLLLYAAVQSCSCWWIKFCYSHRPKSLFSFL